MQLRGFRKRLRCTMVATRRTLRIMKLTAFLLLILCLHASAKTFSQEITLSLTNANLETVFKEIRKQTHYKFLYTKEQLGSSQKVSIEVTKEPLEKVLEICFRNQPLTYVLEDKVVVIRFKEKTIDKVETLIPLQDISGRITNEQGEPLAGATIAIKGTNKATATNDKGEFILTDADATSVLIISSVGYQMQEVRVQGKTKFFVQLKMAINSLDETVVIAYGTTTKRLNTGSVSKVGSEQISKQPVSNPLATLQGRAAGLFITQGNGLPGSNFSVLVRGRNSIQQGTEPLFIIDGVPFPSQKLTQRSQINANNPFNTINTLDIESIEILKDADATAIYGSRGANGVIIITTKKGKLNKTSLDLSIYSGLGKVTRTFDYLSTQDYLTMRREAFLNDGITPDISNAPDLLLWDTSRYTNWKKDLIGGTAHTTNIQISLSGGNDKTRFSFAVNYFKETTVFPKKFGNSRGSGSLNINHQSEDKKFYFNSSASYSSDKGNLIKQDLTAFLNLAPNLPSLYDSVGKLKWSENGVNFFNPYSILLQQYNGTTDRFTSNTAISYAILPKLLLKASVGYNHIDLTEYSNIPLASQDPAFAIAAANFGKSNFKTWIAEPQIEFRPSIGNKNSLLIMVGSSWQSSTANSSLTDASGYPNDNTLGSTAGASVIRTVVNSSMYKYSAIFTRISYNRQAKYLLNITARRDGSSRFGPNKQFANFGAVGVGWIFSKEQWLMKSIHGLSYGKLRGSIGITGNDQIGADQYLDTWSGTQYPYQGQSGYRPTRLFNPDYSWEQHSKIDAAIELGFLKDRILVTANWFLSKSNNQIINYSLPDQTGFSSVLKNFPGVVQNTGWEFEFTSKNVERKIFQWTTNINLTIAKNRLTKFPGIENSSYAKSYVIGQPLNIVQGFKFIRVDPANGIYQFLDKNRDTTYSPSQMTDLAVQGTTNPKFYGGLLNTFQIKDFQIDIFFQFVKQKGIDAIYGAGAGYGDIANQPVEILNRWRKAGDIAPYQKYTQDFGSNAYAAAYYISLSDAQLVDASFIRLKNLSLSYNIPVRILQKLKMQSVRVFVQSQNLLTITSYSGPDPENQSRTSLPPLKTVAFGIQVKL